MNKNTHVQWLWLKTLWKPISFIQQNSSNTNHEVECQEIQNVLKISTNHCSYESSSTTLFNIITFSTCSHNKLLQYWYWQPELPATFINLSYLREKILYYQSPQIPTVRWTINGKNFAWTHHYKIDRIYDSMIIMIIYRPHWFQKAQTCGCFQRQKRQHSFGGPL